MFNITKFLFQAQSRSILLVIDVINIEYCYKIVKDLIGKIAVDLTRKITEKNLKNDLGNGGDKETRTPDPLLAKQMLYQLSYIPTVEIIYSQVKHFNSNSQQ